MREEQFAPSASSNNNSVHAVRARGRFARRRGSYTRGATQNQFFNRGHVSSTEVSRHTEVNIEVNNSEVNNKYVEIETVIAVVVVTVEHNTVLGSVRPMENSVVNVEHLVILQKFAVLCIQHHSDMIMIHI